MHYIRLVVLGDSQVGKTSLIRQLVGEELKFEPEVKCEANLEALQRRISSSWLEELEEHELELSGAIESKRLASLLASQIELQQLLLQQQRSSKSAARRKPPATAAPDSSERQKVPPSESKRHSLDARQLKGNCSQAALASQPQPSSSLLEHPTILISSSNSSLNQAPPGAPSNKPPTGDEKPPESTRARKAETQTEGRKRDDIPLIETTCLLDELARRHEHKSKVEPQRRFADSPPGGRNSVPINQPLRAPHGDGPAPESDHSAPMLTNDGECSSSKRNANHVSGPAKLGQVGAACDTPASSGSRPDAETQTNCSPSRQPVKQMRSLEVGSRRALRAGEKKWNGCEKSSGPASELARPESGQQPGSPSRQQHRHSYCAPFEPNSLAGAAQKATTTSGANQEQQQQLSKQAKIINILFSSNKSAAAPAPPSEQAHKSGPSQEPGSCQDKANRPMLMPNLLRQYQRRLSNFHTGASSHTDDSSSQRAKKGSPAHKGSLGASHDAQSASLRDASSGDLASGRMRMSELVEQQRRRAQLAAEASRAAASLAKSAASAAQALLAIKSPIAMPPANTELRQQQQQLVHLRSASLFAAATSSASYLVRSDQQDETSEQVNLFALAEEYRFKLSASYVGQQQVAIERVAIGEPAQTRQSNEPSKSLLPADTNEAKALSSPLSEIKLMASPSRPRRHYDIKHFCANFIDNMNLYELKIIDMPTIEPSAEFPTSSLLEWSLFRGRSHLLTADAYLLVFDLTRPSTIQYIKMLRDKIFESREMSRVPVYVIANKADLCPTLQPSLQARQMRNIAVRRHQAASMSGDQLNQEPEVSQTANAKQQTRPKWRLLGARPDSNSTGQLAYAPGVRPTTFNLGGEQRSVPAAAAHQLLAAYKTHRMRLGSSGPIVSLRRWAKLRRAVALKEPHAFGASGAAAGFYPQVGASNWSHFERKRMHHSLIAGASVGGYDGQAAGVGAAVSRCLRNCLRRGIRLLSIRRARASRANRKRRRRRRPRQPDDGRRFGYVARRRARGLGSRRAAGGSSSSKRKSRDSKSSPSIDRTESALIRGAKKRKSSVLAGLYQFNWQHQQQQLQRGAEMSQKERRQRARKNKKERKRRKKMLRLKFSRAKKEARRREKLRQKRSTEALERRRRGKQQVIAQQRARRTNWTGWFPFSSGIARGAKASETEPESKESSAAAKSASKRAPLKQRSATLVGDLFAQASSWRTTSKRKRASDATSCGSATQDTKHKPKRAAEEGHSLLAVPSAAKPTTEQEQEFAAQSEARGELERLSGSSSQQNLQHHPSADSALAPNQTGERLVEPICGAMSTPSSRQLFYDLFNRLLQTSSTMAAKTQLKMNALGAGGETDDEDSARAKAACDGEQNETKDGDPKRGPLAKAKQANRAAAAGQQEAGALAEKKPKRRKSSSTGAALWQMLSSLALSRSQSSSERKNGQQSESAGRPSSGASTKPTNCDGQEARRKSSAGAAHQPTCILSDGLKLGTDQYLSADMLRKLSLISSHSQMSGGLLNEVNEFEADQEQADESDERAKSAPEESSGVASALRRASRIWLGSAASKEDKQARSRRRDSNGELAEVETDNPDGSQSRANTTEPPRVGAKRFWYRGLVKKILFHSNKQSIKGIVTAIELQRKLEEEQRKAADEAHSSGVQQAIAVGEGGRATTNEQAETSADTEPARKDSSYIVTAEVHSHALAVPQQSAPSIRIIASGSSLSLVSENHEQSSSNQTPEGTRSIENASSGSHIGNQPENQSLSNSPSSNSISSVTLSESISLNIETDKETIRTRGGPTNRGFDTNADLQVIDERSRKSADDTDNSDDDASDNNQPSELEAEDEEPEDEEEEESSNLDALGEPNVSYQLRKLSADDCLIINRHRRQSLAALQDEQENLLRKFREQNQQQKPVEEAKQEEEKGGEMGEGGKSAEGQAELELNDQGGSARRQSEEEKQEDGPPTHARGEESRRQSIKQSIEAAIHLLVPRAKARSASITLGATDCERRSRSQLGTAIMGAVNVHKTWRDWRQLLGRKKSAAAASGAGGGTAAALEQEPTIGDGFGLLDVVGTLGGSGTAPAPMVGFLSSHVAYKKLSADKQREAAINFDQLMRINQLTLTAANVVMLAASQPPPLRESGASPSRLLGNRHARHLRRTRNQMVAAAAGTTDPKQTFDEGPSNRLDAKRKSHKLAEPGDGLDQAVGSAAVAGPHSLIKGRRGGKPRKGAHGLTQPSELAGSELLKSTATPFAQLRVDVAETCLSAIGEVSSSSAVSTKDVVSEGARSQSACGDGTLTSANAVAAAAAAAVSSGQSAPAPVQSDISAQIAAAAAAALERQRARGERISLIVEPRFDKKQPGAEYPLFVSHDLNPILKDLAQLVRKHWKCNYIECSAVSNWNIRPIISELTRALECNQRFKTTGAGGGSQRATDRTGHHHHNHSSSSMFRRTRWNSDQIDALSSSLSSDSSSSLFSLTPSNSSLFSSLDHDHDYSLDDHELDLNSSSASDHDQDGHERLNGARRHNNAPSGPRSTCSHVGDHFDTSLGELQVDDDIDGQTNELARSAGAAAAANRARASLLVKRWAPAEGAGRGGRWSRSASGAPRICSIM